jgi:hypothetical protein
LIDNGYFPRKRRSTVGPASLATDTYMQMLFNIRDSVTVGEFAFGLAEGSIALLVRNATILSWDMAVDAVICRANIGLDRKVLENQIRTLGAYDPKMRIRDLRHRDHG